MSQEQNSSLYLKLGGRPAVAAVVELFYRRVLGDPTLCGFFEGTDMEQQRRHQVAFVSMALGGPREYLGRSMERAHAGLGIADAHFDSVAGHLGAALQEAGVGESDVATILETVGGLRSAVVGA